MDLMSSQKKWAKSSFFKPDHGADLSRALANEYLRQAGVTNVGQVSQDPKVEPIREVVRSSLAKRPKPSQLGSRAVKKLAGAKR